MLLVPTLFIVDGHKRTSADGVLNSTSDESLIRVDPKDRSHLSTPSAYLTFLGSPCTYATTFPQARSRWYYIRYQHECHCRVDRSRWPTDAPCQLDFHAARYRPGCEVGHQAQGPHRYPTGRNVNCRPLLPDPARHHEYRCRRRVHRAQHVSDQKRRHLPKHRTAHPHRGRSRHPRNHVDGALPCPRPRSRMHRNSTRREPPRCAG